MFRFGVNVDNRLWTARHRVEAGQGRESVARHHQSDAGDQKLMAGSPWLVPDDNIVHQRADDLRHCPDQKTERPPFFSMHAERPEEGVNRIRPSVHKIQIEGLHGQRVQCQAGKQKTDAYARRLA